MTSHPQPAEFAADPDQVIRLAVLAVGGQGGGVITNWIVALAESQGWFAQSTSVPGVAQRTGATIYYVEMVPESAATPVLSLSPTPGDIDIVLAAELMEAGRAIQRGFVTPDRTTLIASSHRALAVSEKSAPGDGRASSPAVLEAAGVAAARFVVADLERLATAQGSVISASLFGALAGSGALPFPRQAFEATISAGGRGIGPSLKAFAAGYDAVAARPVMEADRPTDAAEPGGLTPAPLPAGIETEDGETLAPETAVPVEGPADLRGRFAGLWRRIDSLPAPSRDMARAGLKKVVDYQDLDYGEEYLDRLEALERGDEAAGGAERAYAFTIETAKYLANAMVYDDVIRVADLKTRGSRIDRVKAEIGLHDDQVVQVTEFMHPRAEEVVGMLPAGLGRRIEASPKLMRRIDRLVNRGRRVRTDTVFWFGVLYGLGGLRRVRRSLRRHEVEREHLERWLRTAADMLPRNYPLAVEIVKCRRLVKGYSDTHARGLSKFDRVLSALPLLEGREDGADWLRRLREAALADEEGAMLDGALRTVATL